MTRAPSAPRGDGRGGCSCSCCGETRGGTLISCCISSVKTACERDDAAFILVADVARALLPRASSSLMSLGLFTSCSVSPCTKTPLCGELRILSSAGGAPSSASMSYSASLYICRYVTVVRNLRVARRFAAAACSEAIRSKRNQHTRGVRPGSSSVPIIVCVLPEPVWP